MRIALVPSAFHPAVGGVEELTRRLGLELARRDHAVEVWTSRRPGDDWPRRDTVDGLAVRRFTFPAPSASVASLARWPGQAGPEFARFAAAARRFRPDLLHVQCFSTNGVYATALATVTRRPLLVTLQGETVMDDHDIYSHSAFLRAGLRWGLRRADRVTGCSRFTIDDSIERFGLDPAKAGVVFNGVDLQEVAAEPVDVPFERFFLAMGRVVPKKGFDLLVEAWARVADRFPGVGLVIGGRGEQVEPLRALARDRGVGDQVHLPGVLSRGQVAGAMHAAEFFVMPSRVEPFGIVALEAWRSGTPVVVSSRGGAPEFVTDGATGLVADPFDADGFGAALARLLDNAELRTRLGEAGRRRVEDFTWGRITDRYEQLYAEVAAR